MIATAQTRTQVLALCKYIVVIYFEDSIKRLFPLVFRKAGAFIFYLIHFIPAFRTCVTAATMFLQI